LGYLRQKRKTTKERIKGILFGKDGPGQGLKNWRIRLCQAGEREYRKKAWKQVMKEQAVSQAG
jgi:hypothetical protein